MNAKVEQKSGSETASELVAKHGNKSRAIRALLSEGKTRSEVSKMLGVRYQHVRNVAITPIKKAS